MYTPFCVFISTTQGRALNQVSDPDRLNHWSRSTQGRANSVLVAVPCGEFRIHFVRSCLNVRGVWTVVRVVGRPREANPSVDRRETEQSQRTAAEGPALWRTVQHVTMSSVALVLRFEHIGCSPAFCVMKAVDE